MMRPPPRSWPLVAALLLVSAAYADGKSCTRPPVIVEADAEGSYIFQREDLLTATLVLTCRSDDQARWVVPKDLEDASTVTMTDHAAQSPKYTSTFELTSLYIEDTGYFTCRSATTNCSSHVYAYISTGASAFVTKESPLLTAQGTTDKPIFMGCRTTSPLINVTLYKGGRQITAYPFDPRRGFIIESPAVIMSGQYECRISEAIKLSVLLKVTSGAQNTLPMPNVKPLPNTHFVVGYPFYLECAVASNDPVTFDWIHYDDTPTGKPSETVRSSDKTKKSVYTVKSASLDHSGMYQCKVSQANANSATGHYNVTVLASKDPVLNMTPGPSVINVNMSDPVSWKIMVEFFPPVLNVYHLTPSNERVNPNQGDISSSFNSTTGESWLKIASAQPSHFGNWTLVATTDRLRVTETVKVKVASAPEVTLQVPRSINPGPAVGVACDVTAYCAYKNTSLAAQQPNVTWMMANCTELTPDCHWQTLGIESKMTRISENKLQVEPDTSSGVMSALLTTVWLQCQASCHLGSSSDQQSLVVTDLSDRWELKHVGYGGDEQLLLEGLTNLQVVQNDYFYLSCGATISLYNPPAWLSPRPYGVEAKICNQTEYSTVVCLETSRVTAEYAGRYACSVSDKQGATLTKEVMVSVADEVPLTMPVNSTFKLDQTVDVFVKLGVSTDIVCDPIATPMPQIEWLKDNKPLEDPNIVYNRTTLHFDFFAEGDKGTYTCLMTWRSTEYSAAAKYYVEEDRVATYTRIILGIAGGIIGVLVVASLCLVRRVLHERTKSRKRHAAERELFHEGRVNEINPERPLDEQAYLLPYDSKYEVERSKIHLGRQLGCGAFGRVLKAEVLGINNDHPNVVLPVAVKMTKCNTDPTHAKNLAIELKILIHLGKHLNIVNLIGANTELVTKGEVWILVEYCKYGDLLSFIQKYRKRFVNQIDPCTDTINYSIGLVAPNSATLPFSSGINNNRTNRVSRPSQSSTGPDGYLMPNSALVLADPPKGRNSRDDSPQDRLSPTGSMAFFVHNPGYGKVEVDPSGTARPSPAPQSPGSPAVADPAPHSPFLNSQILLSPISEVPHIESPGPTMAPSPTSPPPHEAPSAPLPLHPYVNVGVTQLPPQSPPPYVSQAFVPPSPPHRNSSSSTGVSTPSYKGSNSYRSGSLSGPYKYNTDMTTVSSSNPPFSPAWSEYANKNLDNHDGFLIPGVMCNLTTLELVCWAWQVAQGMDYLTRRKVLHGDLAARNLLLAEGNVIKISDFGLSRDIYKQNYLKQGDDLLPIKWMSIEAIRDRKFSIESDIWAYGITLWELFSLGHVPYPSIDVNPQFLKNLEGGMRNEQPKFSNKEIYQTMLDCWEEEPDNRPSFEKIMERLHHMMKPDILNNFVSKNENYVQMNRDYFGQRTDYLSMFPAPDFNNLPKEELDGNLRYVDYQSMSEEDRQKAIEFHKMQMASSPGPGEGGGYLPMSVMGDQPSYDPDTIFSPNPIVSPSEPKRFTFHSTEDLVPRTVVSSSPHSSNSPPSFELGLQSPTETRPQGDASSDKSYDDNQERSSLLQPEEAEEINFDDGNFADSPCCNFKVS